MQIEELFNEIVAEVIPNFDEFLVNRLMSYGNDELSRMAIYSIGGGKRIRPLILALVNRSLGQKEDVMNAGFSIELMHSLSLIHDDVIDKEVSRRGNPPFYKTYGIDSSLLITDYIFGVVIDLINQYRRPELIDVLARTSISMSVGEFKELSLFREDRAVSLQEYMDVIINKTASLFGAAAKLGALLSALPSFAEPAYEFGESLGIIYQIKDDMKDKGKVFNELINRLDSEDQMALEEVLRSHYRRAMSRLETFPNNKYRTTLENITSTIYKA
ncbi:MAG: polyprenyl synthetase family protein [Nitrososphaeria archaeon]